MRRFAIKFYAIVAIILPVIAYYNWKVAPNVSGDLGLLNLVPYGQEYASLNVGGMVHPETDSLCVTQIHDAADIRKYPVVTIGDSFSNQGFVSFPHFLGRDHGFKVGNVERSMFYQPVQDYLSLLNAGAFVPGQTAIVEIVEHYYVWRLAWLDFDSTEYSELGPIVPGKWQKDVLSETARWVRLSIGYNNPVRRFKLDKDCFSHPTRARELYVYREEMSFLEISDELVIQALDNLARLQALSREKGVDMYFLICSDKYDAYEPWIAGKHPDNQILRRVPEDDHIIVMTPYMRELIADGVKDVYMVNDGHASTIGAARCAQVLAETLGTPDSQALTN
ncbi:MAG: hypothetical protein IJ653_07980 [Bacteroidales bacterium]|nr:hypothetical protein [Bacteroidales bacterium]